MNDSERRIVVDAPFDSALDALRRAIAGEGLEMLACVDVRAQIRRHVHRDFRRYALLQAWPADLAAEALRHDLEAGVVLPTAFAVYELADGETAIVVNHRFAPADPALFATAAEACERVARVLARVQPTHAIPA